MSFLVRHKWLVSRFDDHLGRVLPERDPRRALGSIINGQRLDVITTREEHVPLGMFEFPSTLCEECMVPLQGLGFRV